MTKFAILRGDGALLLYTSEVRGERPNAVLVDVPTSLAFVERQTEPHWVSREKLVFTFMR